ncbi:hypothetical protein [Alloalcanivorax mobilis]|uniref:hypothetical protein n=1 Tax=Alloalcanivorax mobilis TaxID=2019569 RepID=UPI000C794C5F|nr:hypothetical protein [Alloalcanivorax mobilis]
MRTPRFVLLVLFAALLSACAPPTEVTSGWHAKVEPKPHFQRLFVIALLSDDDARVAVEDALGKALSGQGVQAVLAHQKIGDVSGSDDLRARAEQAVKAAGADGVLVASFLKADVRADYVPGHLARGSDFGSSVGASYDTVYQPGYYVENQDYYMQSTLYRVGSDAAVWQAQSRLINPTSLKKAARGYAGDLADRLRKDGALGK